MEQQKLLGTLPLARGEYDPNVTYYRDNYVTYLGSTFQVLAESVVNTPPAKKDDTKGGLIEYINTDVWMVVADGKEAINAAIAARESISGLDGAVDAEKKRQANETDRERNEGERKSNEATRMSNEQQRIEAEQSRVAAENARVTAEQQRADAEAARQSAEASRVDAENARVEAEKQREADVQKLVSNADATIATNTAKANEAIQTQIDLASKGKPNGIASLDADGKVVAEQLPPTESGGVGDYPICSYFSTVNSNNNNKATSINAYNDRIITAFHFGAVGNCWGTAALQLTNANGKTKIGIRNGGATNYIFVTINGVSVLNQSLGTYERICGMVQVDLVNGAIRYLFGKGNHNALNGTEDVADIVEVSVPELTDVNEPLYITTSYDSYRDASGLHYHGIALGEVDLAAIIAYKPTIGGIMHPSVTQVLTPHQFSASTLKFNGNIPMKATMLRNITIARGVDLAETNTACKVIGRTIINSVGNVYVYNGTAWKLITNS